MQMQDRYMLSGVTDELLLKDYSKSNFNVDEDGAFALVTDTTGKTKTVLKQTIVWYLNNNKIKLSSDQLHRVRAKDYNKSADKDNCNIHHNSAIEKDNVEQFDFIKIGDWCIFEIGERLLIGLLHSFPFVNGKTFKDKHCRPWNNCSTYFQHQCPNYIKGPCPID